MEQYDQIGAGLDRLPSVRFRHRIFGIISPGLLLTGFLSYSGNVVLTKLANNGWLDNFFNAAFISALVFGYFVGSLISGLAGGCFGRCRAFHINPLIVGIATIGAAFVPSMYWLIFFRFLVGIGVGALIMVGHVSFAEFIPTTVRGKWSTWLSFAGNWPPMLSAVTDVVAIVFFSWRIMFLLGGIGILLAWFFSDKYFIESPRWLTGKGQTTGAECQLREVE